MGFVFRKNKFFFFVDRFDDFVFFGVVCKVFWDVWGVKVNMIKVVMVFYKIGIYLVENNVLFFGGGYYYIEINIK